ncbi:hypothetical protein Cma02nite_30710 [Cellulomonas marina]|nr:hypothetical protein Cma02nite_30710 [Cellulomonas marina]
MRAGLRVLRRGPGEVQVGLDPRWAVRVDGLAPSEVEALVALDRERELPAGPAGARRVGALPDAVLPGLLALGVLDEGRADPRAARAAVVCADAACLAGGGGGAAEVLTRREAAVVGVLGLGPTGLVVASTVAAAGVGTVVLDDPGPVRSGDVGPGAYRWADVGSPRVAAAARALADVRVDVRTTADRRPDVLVVVEHGAADPARAPVLLGAGVPHLSVVVREADALVGPFVVPGRTPCLRCLDLARAADDPAWPVVAAQVVPPDPGLPLTDGLGLRRRAGPSAAGGDHAPRTRPTAEEPLLLSGVAGTLAAAHVLAAVDGRRPPSWAAVVEVALPGLLGVARPVHPHTRCGCTGLPPTG